MFKADEIEKIIRLSACLKIYSVISNNEKLKLGQKLHKDVYNKIASEISNTDIIYKIFNVVKTKTFRYNMTDKFMWDYIKTIQCKDIGVHIIENFNFIMNNILILCEEDKNPITYFVGVVDDIKPDRGKVTVLLSLFGRETPVELDFLQVEKL